MQPFAFDDQNFPDIKKFLSLLHQINYNEKNLHVDWDNDIKFSIEWDAFVTIDNDKTTHV